MNAISLLIARLALGVAMMGPGLVHFLDLENFVTKMTQGFEATILPVNLVLPFAYTLPALELAIGVLLIVGLFSRLALILGGLVMIALIFGSALIERWTSIQLQLLYVVFFVLLLNFIKQDNYSLDFLIKKRV